MQGITSAYPPIKETRDLSRKTVSNINKTPWDYTATEKIHCVVYVDANTTSWCYSYLYNGSAYVTLDYIYHTVSGYGCASCNYTLYPGDQLRIQTDRTDTWKILMIPIVRG